jgi:isopenicillin-N epimerase
VFGSNIRHLFELDADATFLNHGSVGVCPKAVLDKQSELQRMIERHPGNYFRHNRLPMLRGAQEDLARYRVV